MKTAHQFARELLDGPDLPVAVASMFLEDCANEPDVAEHTMEDKAGQPTRVLVISAAITIRDA